MEVQWYSLEFRLDLMKEKSESWTTVTAITHKHIPETCFTVIYNSFFCSRFCFVLTVKLFFKCGIFLSYIYIYILACSSDTCRVDGEHKDKSGNARNLSPPPLQETFNDYRVCVLG